VRRCTFTSGEDGVRAHDGSANTLIEKNSFTGIGNDAVDLTADETPSPATNARVEKNKFDDIGDDAIESEGAGHVIEKNRISNVEHGGIAIEDGDGVTIAKNRPRFTARATRSRRTSSRTSARTIPRGSSSTARDTGSRRTRSTP
jgi:hypothetical protein